MINRFFLILFFSSLLVGCQSSDNSEQSNAPSDLPELVRSFSTQNAGSAMYLSGKVHNVIIFIAQKEFPKELQDEQIQLVNEAQDFLIKQARNYGKKVQFSNSYLGYDGNPIIVQDIETGQGRGNERVDWVSFLLEQLNTTPLEFYKDIKKQYQVEHVFVTIIANQAGRGYAFAYEPHFDKQKFFLEGTMQYIGYENGQKNCSASYAHEFLHLFGAWDLYQTFQTTNHQQQLAQKYYPDDIMLATSYDIYSKKIDSLTAYLVGLHNNYNPLFDQFEPKR